MVDLLKKTFHIRDGELKIALYMQLYIFIIITVLLLVKPTINALFLSHLGSEELPTAYLLVAVLAILTSYFYNRLLRFVSIKVITVISLVFFSGIFFLLGYLLYAHITHDYILYAYYLSISLFGVLVTSQFWIIANMVYNVREAKRLFGFIGSGAIAGGIFGGYITSILAESFGSYYVILLASLLILFCIPILLWVWNHRPHNMVKPPKDAHSNTMQQEKSVLKVIFKSKHLTYLALTVGVSVIMAKLVDYQFSDFAHIKITDSHELAAFFGFWFSTFNVISLIIQLFLTNRLLAWFGVTSNLLILPLGIAFGCLLFLVFPELWVLVLLKGQDSSFKQSINKAAIELAIMPVPYEDKKIAKSFIDVVVDSIATGIAGFLLIFVVKELDLHSRYITVIILFFLFVWIVLIYQLRGAYFDSFKKNILKGISRFDKEHPEEDTKPLKFSIIEVLTKGSEKEILELLENLGDSISKKHEPYIIKLLDHPSNLVKAAAIKEIYFFKHDAALSKITDLVETNDDPEVIYEAMEYLLLHTSLDDKTLFEDYLDHSKPYIADAALLCLAELALDNKYLVKRFNLHQRIKQKLDLANDSQLDPPQEEIAELLVTIGYARNSEFFYFINDYLDSKNIYVKEHAIKAAGLSLHIGFIKPVLLALNIDAIRETTIQALQRFGKKIPSYILKLDEKERFDNDIRKHFPKVIASIQSKASLKTLLKLLRSNDAFIRFEGARTLTQLHFKGNGIKFKKTTILKAVQFECDFYRERLGMIRILSETIDNSEGGNIELQIKKEQLVSMLNQELEFSMKAVFEELTLVLNKDDMEIAYYGLKDQSESVKINAIEFLDSFLHKGLKTDLMPLLEYHFIQENEPVDLSSLQQTINSEETCLNFLLKAGAHNTKTAALNLIMLIKDKRPYMDAINGLTTNNNDTISLLAIKVLQAKA